MKNNSSLCVASLLTIGFMILLMSFILPPRHITLYLAGDSTLSQKDVKASPETGWGMPFKIFFDSTVTVKNIAKNGRSTKTFIEEGLWDAITDSLKEGDYVLIQFGHNDEVPTKASYTTATDFTANLQRFIRDVSAKNAKPVLITPAARRKFSVARQIEDTHELYAVLVRKVAEEEHVPLIDLSKKSMSLLGQLGPENSKMLFNHLAPGENPNYPEGKMDDTHFNELGARKMAEIVLAEIRSLKLDLVTRIVSHKIR